MTSKKKPKTCQLCGKHYFTGSGVLPPHEGETKRRGYFRHKTCHECHGGLGDKCFPSQVAKAHAPFLAWMLEATTDFTAKKRLAEYILWEGNSYMRMACRYPVLDQQLCIALEGHLA